MNRILVYITALLVGVSLAATEAASGPPKPPVVIDLFKPVDISKVDHVIGEGSPDSVTEAALAAAVAKGGVITFNTGGKPLTLKLAKPLDLKQGAKPCVLDGQGLVTLDGDLKTRILQKGWKTELTVQRVKFQHARTDKEGAGIYNTMWDGRLTVIDCDFEDCKTNKDGPDIGGGGIRVTGQKNLIVSGCTFTDCEGSNGGAICTIGCQMTIVGNTFTRCKAFGKGGGADAGPQGQGGIGGSIYHDGVSQNADQKQAYVGDCYFKDSYAGDHAGAIFGYTIPKAESLSVYYNCIIENCTVSAVQDTPGDPGHGAAIYSMFCKLHVMNCTFANNKAPAAGPIFAASMVSEQYTNCEYYGNSPEQKPRGGEGITGKRDTPPAVAALGRMPGANRVAKTSSKPAESASSKSLAIAPPKPVEKPAPKLNDPSMLKEFEDKLRENVKAEIAAQRFPKMAIAMLKETGRLTQLDDKGGMLLKLNAGGTFDLKWDKLTPADFSNLAMESAREENPFSYALAGFFLYQENQPERAERQLEKAGEHGKKVRAAFGLE